MLSNLWRTEPKECKVNIKVSYFLKPDKNKVNGFQLEEANAPNDWKSLWVNKDATDIFNNFRQKKIGLL